MYGESLPRMPRRIEYKDVDAQMKRVCQSGMPQFRLATFSGTAMTPRRSPAGLMTQMPPGPVT
jgi:hypothetical protein